MINTYERININLEFDPIKISGYSRINEVAHSILSIIQEKKKTSKSFINHRIQELYEFHSYPKGTHGNVLNRILDNLENQRLIVKTEETLEQYLTGGVLNYRQVTNYLNWLTESKIFEKHGVNNRGLYTSNEELVFKKIAEYKTDGIASVNAVKMSVGDVFGPEKAMQFETWYIENMRERSSNQNKIRNQNRVRILKKDPSKAFGILDFEKLLNFYGGKDHRVKEVILNR